MTKCWGLVGGAWSSVFRGLGLRFASSRCFKGNHWKWMVTPASVVVEVHDGSSSEGFEGENS